MSLINVVPGEDSGIGRRASGQPALRSLGFLHFGGVFSSICSLLATWDERHRHRRQIAQLSDDALNDIGKTRGDFAQEIAMPFWRA